MAARDPSTTPVPSMKSGEKRRTARTSGSGLVLKSPDFQEGRRIPQRHAYAPEGENVPPRLTWSGAPEGTRELALIVDDPDAPKKTWLHWAVHGIPGDARSLPVKGMREGTNDFGTKGWGGPLPPEGHGEHHYHFRLYALDAPLDLAPDATKGQLLDAMRGHVLGEAELVGLYAR